MKIINIEGIITSNDDKGVYEWLGYTATAPKDVNTVLNDILNSDNPNEDVEVRISSGGGYVDAGNDIYSALRNHPGPVNIRIIYAASAASVVAMARHSVAEPTAMIMIHNAWSSAQGDYHEMDRASERLRTINEAMSFAYREKTGMSEDDLLALMDKETWITAERALELGFVDEIATNNHRAAAAEIGVLSDTELKKARKQMAAEAAARRFKALEESH